MIKYLVRQLRNIRGGEQEPTRRKFCNLFMRQNVILRQMILKILESTKCFSMDDIRKSGNQNKMCFISFCEYLKVQALFKVL